MIHGTRSQNLSTKPPLLLALIAGLGLVLALGLSPHDARASGESSSNVEGGGAAGEIVLAPSCRKSTSPAP